VATLTERETSEDRNRYRVRHKLVMLTLPSGNRAVISSEPPNACT
jgi:hypothetical protein